MMILKSQIKKVLIQIYSAIIIRKFGKAGSNITIQPKIKLINPQYINIGNGCYIGTDCRIEAWNKYNNDFFSPEIIIGNDVKINSTCHIGAINRIIIGDSCLLGSHVFITDHSHGKFTKNELLLHPSDRDLYSKGDVIIGKRCWICENVVILPGVTIGDNSIIGAGAVVTKNIPANVIAAGNPAVVVKKLSSKELSETV